MAKKVKIAQALYDFDGQQSDELSFRQGEYLQVVDKVDTEWMKGFLRGIVGIFPATFVHIFHDIYLAADGKVFVCIEEFPELQPGDLALKPGDLIVGLDEINLDWWRGHLEGEVGVFPLTHVQEIQLLPQNPPSSVTTESRNVTGAKAHKDQNQLVSNNHHVEKTSHISESTINNQSSMYDIESDPYFTINSAKYSPSLSSQPTAVTNTQAKALYDFKAELPTELTLRTGDIISFIKSTADSEWLEGTVAGKTGLFPAAFAELISDGSLTELSAPELSTQQAFVLYDFQAETQDEINLYSGQSVNILELNNPPDWTRIRTVSGSEGLCPTSFLNTSSSNVYQHNNRSKPNNISSVKQSAFTKQLSLDDVVSEEMTKARLVSEKRRSLQPKPPKPPSPAQNKSNTTSIKPPRPPMSKQASQKSLKDSATVFKYDTINEPYESSLDWKDQHPAPVIVQKPESRKEPSVKSSPPQTELTAQPSSIPRTAVTQSKSPPATSPKPVVPPPPSRRQTTPIQNKPTERDVCSEDEPEQLGLRNGGETLTSSDITNSASKVTDSPETSYPTPGPSVLLPTRTAPAAPTRAAPSRTAPPPPLSAKPKVVPPRPAPAKPADSPAGKEPDSTASVEYDEQAVEVLKQKIKVLEDDIERYNEEVENLDGLTAEDVDEKLEFYMENINGMSEEVHELKEQLAAMMQAANTSGSTVTSGQESQQQRAMIEQAKKEKIVHRKEKRQKVINELLDTERAHLKDLKLCLKVFVTEPFQPAPDGLDLEALFSNMTEVIEVSQKFVSLLEAEVAKPFEEQVIGTTFIAIVEDMKSAYAPYCRNHDDVCALLEQYKDNSEVQGYFSQGLEEMKKFTAVFTIGAFLIKPVQRVLKYPLLLNEMYEATEDSHPDKAVIKQAQFAQRELAQHINEYKRRKDLVFKYRKGRDESLTDRMARLNMHSIKKKSTRFSMKLSSTMGLVEQTVDKDFEREEQYFKALDRSIRSFAKNVDQFLQQLQESLDVKENVATGVADLVSADRSKEVEAYQSAQQSIAARVFRQFKVDTDTTVVTPLTKLMGLFHSPAKVIDKRHDKLLDYDSCQSRVDKMKDIEQLKKAKEDLQAAKNDYEALNAQLKDELPRFNQLAYDIFKDSIKEFVQLYNRYQSDSLKLLYPLLQLPALAYHGNSMETFESQQTKAAEIIFNNPVLTGAAVKVKKASDARKTGASLFYSGQSEAAKAKLLQSYPSSKLYTVTGAYNSSDPLDIPVSPDDLVAVLIEKDPMGNKERWYVDNGDAKGFVPQSYLTAYSQTQSPPPSYNTVMTNLQPSSPSLKPRSSITPVNSSPKSGRSTPLQGSPRHSQVAADGGASATVNNPRNSGYVHQSQPHTQQQQGAQATSAQQYEKYRALYTFKARNDNEISITVDQIVFVYAKYDENGNTAWWYIQTHEGYGYAPANYLTPA